jgi:radical SAM protein with 4Fe4S-binding SPASM domain
MRDRKLGSDGKKFEEKYPSVRSFVSFRHEAGGGFVFNPYLYGEKWLNEVEYCVLELSNGTRSVSEIIESVSKIFALNRCDASDLVCRILMDLESYCALRWREKPISKPDPLVPPSTIRNGTDYYSAPNSVLWYLTYNCNMKCKHCLVGDLPQTREMSLDEAKYVLGELKRMKIFSINFSGGEPLLRPDLFEIIRAGSEMHFGMILSTNGLSLNQDILNKLKDSDVYQYQISLDGIGEIHDEFRGVKGGYEKALNALSMVSRSGLHAIMSTMITMKNIHQIGELLELAASLGVSTFKLNAFMPHGRGRKNKDELKVPNEMLRALAIELAEKKERYKDTMNIQLDSLSPWLLEKEQDSSTTIKGSTDCRLRCSASQTTLVLAPDGEIFSCPYLTDFPLGNVLTDSLHGIWNNNSSILGKFRKIEQNDLMGKCRNCKYVPTKCNGGCRAAAYLEAGDFYGEDPLCWK